MPKSSRLASLSEIAGCLASVCSQAQRLGEDELRETPKMGHANSFAYGGMAAFANVVINASRGVPRRRRPAT